MAVAVVVFDGVKANVTLLPALDVGSGKLNDVDEVVVAGVLVPAGVALKFNVGVAVEAEDTVGFTENPVEVVGVKDPDENPPNPVPCKLVFVVSPLLKVVGLVLPVIPRENPPPGVLILIKLI